MFSTLHYEYMYYNYSYPIFHNFKSRKLLEVGYFVCFLKSDICLLNYETINEHGEFLKHELTVRI